MRLPDAFDDVHVVAYLALSAPEVDGRSDWLYGLFIVVISLFIALIVVDLRYANREVGLLDRVVDCVAFELTVNSLFHQCLFESVHEKRKNLLAHLVTLWHDLVAHARRVAQGKPEISALPLLHPRLICLLPSRARRCSF